MVWPLQRGLYPQELASLWCSNWMDWERRQETGNLLVFEFDKYINQLPPLWEVTKTFRLTDPNYSGESVDHVHSVPPTPEGKEKAVG